MNKVIVTTTINPPTEAIRKFDAMKDWTLVVAGDRKTPVDYDLDNGVYLSPAWQLAYDVELSDAIGWNCIQRRNFAFLYACKEMKADIIATVDDDNIPLDGWGTDIAVNRPTPCWHITTEAPCCDPVFSTVNRNPWHRGFPIQLTTSRRVQIDKENNFNQVSAHIQADMWFGNGDVDAICRMTHGDTCYKEENQYPFPAVFNRPSPFNSQNTFLHRDVMPHYFMFPGIGRMDDIWAGYHVQAQGFKVIYGKPSVVQKRNLHDPIEDMKQEYLGYENNLKIVEAIVTDKNSVLGFLPERARMAFALYQRHFE